MCENICFPGHRTPHSRGGQERLLPPPSCNPAQYQVFATWLASRLVPNAKPHAQPLACLQVHRNFHISGICESGGVRGGSRPAPNLSDPNIKGEVRIVLLRHTPSVI